MRVYEFAKKVNIPSKDLLKAVRKAGFEVGSHMSVITPEVLKFLEKNYSKKGNGAPKKPVKLKEPAPEKVKKDMSLQIQKKQSRVTSPAEKKVTHERPKALIIEPMDVATLAQEIGRSATELIVTMLGWGIVAPKNQVVSEDIVARVAQHYGIEARRPATFQTESRDRIESLGKDIKERPPVVCVLGHVDHGKTTLLDFIRSTRVASREKGGITQHLGAYQVKTGHGNLIFLDTPGHEAFTKIRARGVKSADIAVLVIAADDGIMPQTVEAIKHAKEMDVPIVVAINKIDKADKTRIDVVMRQLSQHDLLPEEWGGQIITVPISAKTGLGVDKLLELIALQAELMELKADTKGFGRGYILEAKLERGRGPVATLITQQGKVHLGDYFVCGSTAGRISSLVDSHGARLKVAGPSNPVQVAGFDSLPEPGSYFEVVPKEHFRKARNEAMTKPAPPSRLVLNENAINLIVKTDTNSSKEALIGSIAKLSKKLDVDLVVVQSSVGDISEGDVEFAKNTGSRIVGLHVKAEPNAASLAQRRDVTIETHDIIYRLLESLEGLAEQAREIPMVNTKIGEAIVRKVFDIKNVGVIAGCYVQDGRFSKDGTVVVWRGRKKVGEGKITSLQRENKNVKEVHSGFECAFMAKGLTDFQEDDRIECFIQVPGDRK